MRRVQAVRRKQALVEVDREACESLALLLKDKHIPSDSEDTYVANFSAREMGNFYFCLVAICHQTSPRGKPALEGYANGVYKKGWDYLAAKFEAAAQSDPTLITPSKWSEITEAEIRAIFHDSQYWQKKKAQNDPAVVNGLARSKWWTVVCATLLIFSLVAVRLSRSKATTGDRSLPVQTTN